MIVPDTVNEDIHVSTWMYQIQCACGDWIWWTFTGFTAGDYINMDVEHRGIKKNRAGSRLSMLNVLSTAAGTLVEEECTFPWKSPVTDWLIGVEL